jgi:ribosomal protein L25 (general stress protein Ctc)
MEKFFLDAEKREVIGKQVKALRRDGKLPAVIYGQEN